MHKENQSEEEGLRKRKTKLMNEVKTCLNSYDAALTAKQDEIDEVRVRAALLVVCFHTPFRPRCLTLRRVSRGVCLSHCTKPRRSGWQS